jgi:hypothetical protein
MKFINCTPHPVMVVGSDNQVILTLPKGDVVPRLSETTKVVEVINGIDITETIFGDIQDLPEPQTGVFLVVSRLVLSACKDRTDLLVPNGVVRDENGNILGCKSFARN